MLSCEWRLSVYVNLKFVNRSKCKTNVVYGGTVLCDFEDACICREWLRLKVPKSCDSIWTAFVSGQVLYCGFELFL